MLSSLSLTHCDIVLHQYCSHPITEFVLDGTHHVDAMSTIYVSTTAKMIVERMKYLSVGFT